MFAKQAGGSFILRVEDTDKKRKVEGAEEYVISALKWCGISADESVIEGGGVGPYRQSERSVLYENHIKILIDKGLAYYAFDSEETLEFHRDDHQKKGKTFSWGGRYAKDWDNRQTLFTELGVFKEFDPVLKQQNKEVPIIFLANIHPVLQLSVLDQCTKRKFVIIDTMNLWIDTEREKLKEVISSCDVLLINEFEAEQFTRRKNHDDQGTVLQALGPQNIIVKCGSKGAKLYAGHQLDTIGVFPIKNVIDPTGAGDAFGGGIAASLANGETMIESIINGSALASLTIEGFGIDTVYNASVDEIEKRKEHLRTTLNS